jgi:hypothetical protein
LCVTNSFFKVQQEEREVKRGPKPSPANLQKPSSIRLGQAERNAIEETFLQERATDRRVTPADVHRKLLRRGIAAGTSTVGELNDRAEREAREKHEWKERALRLEREDEERRIREEEARANESKALQLARRYLAHPDHHSKRLELLRLVNLEASGKEAYTRDHVLRQARRELPNWADVARLVHPPPA